MIDLNWGRSPLCDPFADTDAVPERIKEIGEAMAERGETLLRPVDTEYWLQRPDKAVGIGHAFKYPYSGCDLLRHCREDDLVGMWEEKAWHVF